jgi:uncharacterized protein
LSRFSEHVGNGRLALRHAFTLMSPLTVGHGMRLAMALLAVCIETAAEQQSSSSFRSDQGETYMASNQGGNQGSKGSQAGKTGGRGFASMDAQRQREIASQGGRAAHQRGTAHEFTSEEAREAGRKGGEAVSQNRQHMAAIGSKGGQSRGRSSRAKQAGTQAATPASQNQPATPGGSFHGGNGQGGTTH